MISDCRFKKQKDAQGSTLIEIMIYVAIIGLVVVSFIQFSVSISNSRGKVYVEQEVQANARVALNLISQKIRVAKGVNTGASTFDSDPGVLSLEMADAAKNPTIFSLSADDGVLQITEGTADPVNITSDETRISNLIFTDLTATSSREHIRVQLEVEYAAEDIIYEYKQSLQTAASLRE